jgi:hypothetical protein
MITISLPTWTATYQKMTNNTTNPNTEVGPNTPNTSAHRHTHLNYGSAPRCSTATNRGGALRDMEIAELCQKQGSSSSSSQLQLTTTHILRSPRKYRQCDESLRILGLTRPPNITAATSTLHIPTITTTDAIPTRSTNTPPVLPPRPTLSFNIFRTFPPPSHNRPINLILRPRR